MTSALDYGRFDLIIDCTNRLRLSGAYPRITTKANEISKGYFKFSSFVEERIFEGKDRL